ncbi:unnamed protein product [Closterium sp. Yama58-4]|nr:unnamed protein product [Closterium sp. Yama58-4]
MTLLLIAACLAALSFVRPATAGLSGYSVPLDASQVPALQDCQTEWKVVMPTWSAGKDCAVASYDLTGTFETPRGILCDDNGMVTSLNMAYQQLKGSIPASIGNLVQLQYLVLNDNFLSGSIPDAIGRLRNLNYLYLNGNELTDVPQSMSGLYQLKEVNLAENLLSGSLPKVFEKLNLLVFLSLASNQLAGVFTGLSVSSSISALDLSNNYLTGQLNEWQCNNIKLAETRVCPQSAGDLLCAGSVGIRELVEPTILTKGTEEATTGVFTAGRFDVATYQTVTDGCGADLPIRVEFTFFMFPSAGGTSKAGQGLAFVISATNAAGTGGEGGGVGYAGMDARSIAVEFDTFTDAAHGDMPGHHVGLNTGGSATSIKAVRSPFTLNNQRTYTAWIDYKPGDPGGPGTLSVYLAASGDKPETPLLESPLSLCDVLQPSEMDRWFYFGFVASSVAPYQQQHAILVSFIETGLTVPTPSKPVPSSVISPAYGLSVSQTTFRPASASPFTRYVSAAYALSGQQDAWLLRDPSSWDVPWLSWPIKDQDDCNACWAYAVVASIEAAYGIATNKAAPQLSVDSLFAAMGLTTQSKKCTKGGSPTEAFEKLLALPKKGLTLATNNMTISTNIIASVLPPSNRAPVKYYPVQGFERTRFKGYVGLMLAVQRQPVVVHIQASAPTFAAYDGTYKYLDPACYTGQLNHVVLVVGYSVVVGDSVQRHIAPPFWIIRNSWGAEWGYNGHMRMDIQQGDGVCGINVLPGIYPIVKIPGDPCGTSSFKADREFEPTFNPCGRFKCTALAKSNGNSCKCIIPTASLQPFVEVANGVGATTCVYADVCGSQLKNPCSVGTCINDGKGSYSCICPPDYIPSQTVDGFPTCDPAGSLATSLAVSGSNWGCADVHPLMGLTLTQFTQRNKALDCSKPLKLNAVLQLAGSPAVPCTAFFYVLAGDTCDSIASYLRRNIDDLLSLNPGLSCEQGIKAGRSVCVERNPSFAFTVPQCLKYTTLTAEESCEVLLDRAGGYKGVGASAWDELYRNNPGLVCSGALPPSASAAGSKAGLQVCLKAEYWPFTLGRCIKGRAKSVSPSLSCSGAYTFYGGASSAAAAKFSEYNGKACASNVGSKYICVPR